MLDAFDPIPFREIPGLTSIVFYESSNNWPLYEAYEVALVDDARLIQRLPDPLAVGNYDFQGGGDGANHHEFYEVFSRTPREISIQMEHS